MTSNPDDIRRDIEQTRRELASDVDTLHEKVSPSAVAHRRVESVKGAATSAKEKVMGSASDAGGSVSSATGSVASAAGSAPDAARRQTRGNPLAAGLIAFGAGWLVSSLLPASEKEQQAATQAKDKVSEHSDTLTAPLKEAAQGAKDNLQEPARQAAESVRSTATDAAQTVKDDAQSAKDDVAGQAQHARDQVAGESGTTDVNRPVGTGTSYPR